jgi:hypothetical protein
MIEAMKQWLEALEDFVDVIKYDNEQDDIGRRACCDVLSYNPHREDCKAIKSIASLRQAIAELESQEPVAWRIKVETKLRDGSLDVGYQPRNEKMSAYDEPLYTNPQRTWVGLTDEEENEYNYLGPDMHWVIQEIAAKLKEKNT